MASPSPSDSGFLALIEAVLSLAVPPLPQPQIDPGHPIKAGGYSDDIFTNLTEQEKDEYECSICYQILKETMQCINKHKYCLSCIFTWSSSGVHLNRTKCPVCRTHGYYTHDLELDTKINKKVVKCHLNGCKWSGELLYLHSHKHTNYDFPTASSVKSTVEHPLPQLRRRNAVRSVNSRTGLSFPVRHLHLRRTIVNDGHVANNPSDGNNNTINATVVRESQTSLETGENIVHTPRPPSTPRPAQHSIRRQPNLPSLLPRLGAPSRLDTLSRLRTNTQARPEHRNVRASATSPDTLLSDDGDTSSTSSSDDMAAPILHPPVGARLSNLRDRLDTLSSSLGSVLDERREWLEARQARIQEVHSLGTRLGLLAGELRRLLNQRSVIRGDIDGLLDE